jgi:hypothetical protein
MRPINIATGPHFTVTCSGVGGVATPASLTAGTYSTTAALAQAFIDAFDAALTGTWAPGHGSGVLSSALILSVSVGGSGGTLSVAWTSTTVRDALGFAADLSFAVGAMTVVAPYSLGYVWLPPYTHSDQGVWYTDQGELFAGVLSQEGMAVGGVASPRLYYRDMAFPHCPATGLVVSKATNVYEAERSLETLSYGSRTATPALATDACPRGLFVVFDAATVARNVVPAGSSAIITPGGVQSDLTSAPNTYVFCSLPPDGVSGIGGSPSMPTGSTRYNVTVSVQTAIEACPDFVDWA